MVSPEFLGLLGVGLSAGRSFTDAEHRSGGPRAVLLSHELWQRRYGGDPGVIGRTVDLSLPDYLGQPGGRHLVVGVLAPQTWLFWRRFDLVTPLRADPKLLGDPRARLIENAIARLRPGATESSARTSTCLFSAALRQAGGGAATDTIQVTALRSALFRDLQPKLHLVLAIALVVFLLAGVNVAVAASSAALERRSETALRLALGGSPARLVREAGMQLLLTVGVSSLVALLLARTFITAILGIVPDAWLARVPGGAGAVRVETLGAAITVMLLIALGAMSALWTWRQMARLSVTSLLEAIQHGDAPARHRWRAMIVAGEVALCTTVVLVASTLGLQLWELRRVDLGVRAERTSAVWINANPVQYRRCRSAGGLLRTAAGRMGRVPGVEAVAGIDLPFHMDWQPVRVSIADRRAAPSLAVLDRATTASYRVVGGLTLVDGRWFDPQDRPGAPDVAVVSRSLAATLWPRQRAVGQTLHLDGTNDRKPLTVVGVVSDVRQAPQAEPARIVYRSMSQAVPQWLYVLIRADLTPSPDRRDHVRRLAYRCQPDDRRSVDGAEVDRRPHGLCTLPCQPDLAAGRHGRRSGGGRPACADALLGAGRPPGVGYPPGDRREPSRCPDVVRSALGERGLPRGRDSESCCSSC